MRKQPLIFLVSVALALFCLTYFPARAQNDSPKGGKQPAAQKSQAAKSQAAKLKQVPELVKTSKAAGATFDRRELFKAAASVADAGAGVRAALSGGSVFELDRVATAKIMEERAGFLTLPLPDGKGGTVELELVQVDIFAQGFTVKTSQPTREKLAEGYGLHYRGMVKGNERSLAAVSVFKNEVMGFYSTAADGNSVLGRLGGDNPSDTHVVYSEKDLRLTSDFHCDTPDTGVTLPVSALQEPEELLARCVRIYIEANFDLFQNKGSVANTTSYITGMFNQSAALFANDGVPVSISEIFVWNSASPYTGTTSHQQLEQFKAGRTSFNGDLAHLLSLQSGLGGVAYLNTLCNSSFRYAFSAIHSTFSAVPTYSWTVGVFTHETGHNLGSPHTHACAWNGDNTAIDSCATNEGSCPSVGIPTGGGTIMSYCHLLGTVGINFSLGFGPQPRNLIVNRFNAAGCLTDCGGGGGGTTAPANNNFASAQAISGNTGATTGSNTGANKETGEPNHAGNAGGASVWYQWQAPASGTVTMRTAGSSFDTLLAVYTGSSVGALTAVAFNDDVANGVDRTSSVTFNATAGTTYRVAVDGYGGETGSVALAWANVPVGPINNNFVAAQVITGAGGTVSGVNFGATKEVGEPAHGGNAGGASVWYQWQAPSSGNATFTTTGSSFDTLLGAYTGAGVSALTTLAGNDDFNGSYASSVTFPVTAGGIYRIAVDGYGGSTGNIVLNWSMAAACTFSITPTSQLFGAAGGSGSVAVTAPAGCAWTAVSNASLAVITSGASGTGSGTVNYTVAPNAGIATRSGTLTIAGQTFTVNQAANAASSIQLGAAAYAVNESARQVLINVTRTGVTTSPASVNYATADGTASRLRDYSQTLGTLNFAANEASKTVTVFVTNDAFVESAETFTFTLTNAAGATLGTPAAAVVTITSDDATSGANPVGDAAFSSDFFVRQHYIDFLNREADASGLGFWTGEINQCGTNVICRDVRRINVSAAFFLSIEFQETGYLVYRLYKSAYGDAVSPNVAGTVPVVRLEEFLPDTQRIGQGVIVNVGAWRVQLEDNKQAFALEFVQRARFLAAFPATMTPAQYVDKLRANTGVALTQAERDQLVAELTANNTAVGRASVLRKVAEDATLQASEFNRAFVLMQYFGYLRRNPNDAPDSNFGGWKFWLDKLNQFGGNYVNAEMVNAFITSSEYRGRFGP